MRAGWTGTLWTVLAHEPTFHVYAQGKQHEK